MHPFYHYTTNNDVAFTPGLLKELAEKSKNQNYGIIKGKEFQFDLFLIKDWVIQKIGLFDENCYPAYCEDIDYILRINRYNWDNGNIIKKTWVDALYYHGNSLSNEENI